MTRNASSPRHKARQRSLNFEKLENHELLAVFAEKVAELPANFDQPSFRPQNYFQAGNVVYWTVSDYPTTLLMLQVDI